MPVSGVGGADRPKEEKPRRARQTGLAQQPDRRDRVQLLDAPTGLIADRGREMHNRVDAPHGLADGERVGEVAHRDLHSYAVGTQAPGVADEAPDVLTGSEQTLQQ